MIPEIIPEQAPSTHGFGWLVGIPFGQVFSAVSLIAFVATAAFSLAGLDVVPAGKTPGPIANAWPTILVWALTVSVLHQAVKIWKGGVGEVDQQ